MGHLNPTLYGFRVGGCRLSDKNAPTCACGVVVCLRRSLRRSQEMGCRNHMLARRCKTGMQVAIRNSTFLSIFSLFAQVEIDQNHFSRTFPRPIQCHHIWACVSVCVLPYPSDDRRSSSPALIYGNGNEKLD